MFDAQEQKYLDRCLTFSEKIETFNDYSRINQYN